MSVITPLQRFFAPPPPAPRRSDAEVARVYPSYRWRALEATFLGYAFYYLVRNNVPVVAPELRESLGYTREMIGNIGAVTALTYGLSKFLMGSVSDRSDPRRFMAAGLALTAVCNFAFGASASYQVHLWLWGLNGFFQGMGWPPCGRVMGHWFSESERGFTFSIWNTSHNIGGGIAGLLAAGAVEHFGGWQYAFYVPGVLALIGAVYLFIRLRDTPQSVGLPPIEEFRNDFPAGGIAESEIERELTYRELLVDKVLLNPFVWLLAIANFFAYIARYSMIDWGPTYLREVKGASLTEGGLVQTAIEFGGVPSTIFFGWVSDRIGGRRSMVAALCMLPIIFAYAVIATARGESLWLDYLMLITIGCFIYPVINLITIAALDNVSKKAIGTAAGFIGLLGYIGKMVEAKAIGRFIDQNSAALGPEKAWAYANFAILACAVIAMFVLALMWKLKPRA
jgi:OPA family glycerol-3-phosphate transporter-like MFS transporter